jgi:transcriptional regulator with XRE-family HTH domain
MEIFIGGIRYLPEPKPTNKTFSFSEAIYRARKNKKETLDEASKNIGISKSQLWSMEKGETEPKLSMLQKVLRYYGVSFDSIDAERV